MDEWQLEPPLALSQMGSASLCVFADNSLVVAEGQPHTWRSDRSVDAGLRYSRRFEALLRTRVMGHMVEHATVRSYDLALSSSLQSGWGALYGHPTRASLTVPLAQGGGGGDAEFFQPWIVFITNTSRSFGTESH